MANRFDSFFVEYKRSLREYESCRKKAKHKPHNWTVIIAAGIAMLLSLTLLLFRVNDVLCSCISLAIMCCCIVLIANIEPYPPSGPDVDPYHKHMCKVIDLLKDNGINITDTDKIKTMIEYANALIVRRDPFVDIKRILAVTGSIGVAIISAMSGAVQGTITLLDGALFVLSIMAIAFVTGTILSPILSFVSELVYPDKKKLNKLIVDLNQILMFDINGNMTGEDCSDVKKESEAQNS